MMQRLAHGGELGQLVSLCSRRLCFIDPAGAAKWRGDHALSGGVMLEINIHELDWMMAIGGEVESVYARIFATDTSNSRNNDHVWVSLNFANGATGTHEGSWLPVLPQFFRSVQGTQAGLSTGEWGSTLLYGRGSEGRETIAPEASFDLRGNFLDSIDNRAVAVADANYGSKVMAVIEAIFESAAANQVVNISRG